MAQLIASVPGVVLGGVVMVVGSNLARGKILTASIGSVDSLYPSVYIDVQEALILTTFSSRRILVPFQCMASISFASE